MSVLFPKINKAPTWEWRPIYYDPKKDEMDAKLQKLQAERAAKAAAEAKQNGEEVATEKQPYTPTLHRGSFREAKENSASAMRANANRQSRLVFWVVLFCIIFLVFYGLTKFV